MTFPFIATTDRALAQVIDVCTGLSVNLPVLQPVSAVASGLLFGALDPILNGIIGNVNANIRDPLSGQNIGLTVLDKNGNTVAFPSNNCNIEVDKLQVDTNQGISLGGGRIDGLGGTANQPAVAGEINSIAIGNGAATAVGATSSVGIGLRSSITAIDGVGIGRDTSVTASGGVALGAGSIASRAGMNGATEAFSGTAVASTAGAVSVGTAGAERQITNVAGGTQATDAVNVRQLRAVGDSLATSLGGGATFNAVTGAYTGPSYTINGNTYNDVGSALAAISGAVANVPLASNNTSGFAAPTATGVNSLAGGYGATSAGAFGVAFGTQAAATGDNASAYGASASAVGAGSIAIGFTASSANADAIAIGRTTSVTADNGIAIGLRSTVAALDGTALGRDTSVTASGGVALGAGSVAARTGLSGGAEAFSGIGVASTAGAISVGTAGAERQITNVAGGTQATDAVNVRQLRAVGTNLATSLGGGATFNAITGLYTGPSYVINGNTYNDVGTALAAITSAPAANVPLAANNTSGLSAPTAVGNDSLSVGYGASAGGQLSAAFGTQAAAGGPQAAAFGATSSATGQGATAIGATASASGTDSVALGRGAVASQPGAIAIGSGVTAALANQVAIGTAQQSYRMAGITSAQSAARQSGPVGVVTSDASGNLAVTNLDPASINTNLYSIASSLSWLGAEIQDVRREARQGIAAAMSMTSAPMPSKRGKTTWALNTATFKSEWAGGMSVAHRLDVPETIAVTAGYSNGGGGSSHGVRVGLAGEF